MTDSVEVAFWKRVDVQTAAECWVWKGSLWVKGYGRFYHKSLGRKAIRAHRMAYILSRGPIPTGLVIDHLCRNRLCMNPAHMEIVTNKENVLRGIGPTAMRKRKTHCIRGHELAGENVVVRPTGARRCKVCQVLDRRRDAAIHKQRMVARRALIKARATLSIGPTP